MISSTTAVMLAATTSESSGDWSQIGLVFFLSGFIFFGVMYFRYRNADKRYQHESRTRSVRNNLRVRDDYARSLTDLHSSSIQGANNRQVSGSTNALSALTGAAGGNVQQLLGQLGRFRR